MATKAKKTTKVSAAKSTKSSKSPVNSKKVKGFNRDFWNRTNHIFYVVLVAAALIAISVGFMTYNYKKGNDGAIVSASQGAGTMFLQPLSTPGAHTAGDSVEATLYEDSGKQGVNALQGAVRYPADKLEVVSVKTGETFSQEAATDTATSGLIRIARSIQTDQTPVKGSKAVVTITFKVLEDSPAPFKLTLDDEASLLVRGSDNQNILRGGDDNTYDL